MATGFPPDPPAGGLSLSKDGNDNALECHPRGGGNDKE